MVNIDSYNLDKQKLCGSSMIYKSVTDSETTKFEKLQV